MVYVPMIIYWLLVSIVNAMPPGALSRITINDKVGHCLAYFILTGFLCITNMVQDKSRIIKTHPFITAFLFAALYGMINEVIQLYVPGRSCDFQDWLADVAGGFLAVLILYPVFYKAIRSFKESMLSAKQS
jgi:VanZ family protein